MKRLLPAIVVLTLSLPGRAPADTGAVIVGSKAFPESQLLAEILAQRLEVGGFEVVRRFNLGGTLICYEALRTGEIDLYPEYTGTIAETLLDIEGPFTDGQLADGLAAENIGLLERLGFNNTYVLVAGAGVADRLKLETISDLVAHDDLRLAFSHEFRNRPDGWPGLSATYGLRQTTSGIEHALAYQAIAEDKIDVTDAYSTDGSLERFRLVPLKDDKAFFPEYHAVTLVRDGLDAAVRTTLNTLASRIDDRRMQSLNAAVLEDGRSFADVAGVFLEQEGLSSGQTVSSPGLWASLGRNTLTHLKLTLIALFGACVVGVSLAVLVYRDRRVSRPVLYLSGLLQTVPSLALLALMIPLLGVGQTPAIAALFLYSLLPILRNGITAMVTIDPLYRKVAEAMGLTRMQQVRHVLFPLALPHVIAGVKTAAVISIGTATLAAFIGAGGLGEPILTGVQLNDTGLILQGAIPAALLAVITELGFEVLERRLVPAHMVQGKLAD